ncbi:interleukin-17 receptor A isoform X1 [Oncorhynchus tshawytscha]|uniref:SEFIR domain-containing protein n=1 Tax=Oncorhynchus tshawytscha TaxID=74940 RepID=A0A8C8C7P7_ONCTS|nr:interleukin-17 receptor A isoform X1 [Oncorhynchus tshawytscha]
MELYCVWLIIFGLTLTSTLRILEWPPLNCTQLDLQCSVQINNCSDDGWIKPRHQAPNGPLWHSGSQQHVFVRRGESGDLLPVMSLSWSLQINGGVINGTSGTEVHVTEEDSNQSICVRYIFHNKIQNMMTNWKPWTFSLDRVVVDPENKYSVSIYNLPKPDLGNYRLDKIFTIPGCKDPSIKAAKVCLENGSLWDPQLSWTVSVDGGERLIITVGFNTAEFSDEYQISIQNIQHSQHVTRENRTSLNVTFELDVWQLPPCEMLIVIQPFFIRCKSNCLHHQTKCNYCSYYQRPPTYSRSLIIKALLGLIMAGGFLTYLLQKTSHTDPGSQLLTTPRGELEGVQIQERKRKVLIIYSLDHPLYIEIVLKLCAFLMAKCGMEVVLDLLDSARLGIVGSVQWLDWQREQIVKSSDKILILCSRGVRAKWRAMCDGAETRVILREDVHSPMGDMLTPALSLLVPSFVRSGTFQNYMVAYFEDVCSEEDVPSPFNIIVRYKLMKHFEELFFRLLDKEKHEPGRVNRIEGITEDEYFQCPSGKALREAVEAFHAYQLEHPNWFEDELVKDTDEDVEVEEPSLEHHAIEQPTESPLTIRQSVPECIEDGPSSPINDVTPSERDHTVYSATLHMTEGVKGPTSNESKPFPLSAHTHIYVSHPAEQDGSCNSVLVGWYPSVSTLKEGTAV